MNSIRTRSLRRTTARALAAIGLLAACASAHAQSQLTPNSSPPPLLNLTSVAVDPEPADQFDPHVDGPLIAYTKAAGIWYFRVGVDTAPQRVPCDSCVQELLSKVSGPFITYTQVTTDRSAAMLFDTTQPAGPANPYEIDPRPGVFRFGAVMGASTVAFLDTAAAAGGALVAWDAAVPQALPVQVAADGANANPAVSPDGKSIVWQRCPTGTFTLCDIWKASRSGGAWTTSVVSANAANEEFPDTDGNRIVYDSSRSTSNIYFRDASLTEYQIALPGYQINPRIAGDFVTFESRPDQSYSRGDILLYQFSTNRLWNLTNVAQAGINVELDDVTVLPNGELIVVYDSDEQGTTQRTVHAIRFGVTAASDTAPPTIAIVTPASGALYLLNSPVTANYGCTDTDSGVASCQGPVANASAVPTATAGAQTFVVNARDNAGNTSSASASYVVGYAVSARYDPTQAKKSGSTYPIRIQLLDASGRNVSSDAIVVHAMSVTQLSTNAPGVLSDAGNSNPDFDFRYDAATGSYIFNLQTTGFATGTYALGFTAGADPVVHATNFQIK